MQRFTHSLLFQGISPGVFAGAVLMVLLWLAAACSPRDPATALDPSERPVVGHVTCWFPDGTYEVQEATRIFAHGDNPSIFFRDLEGNEVVVGTAMCGASIYPES